MIHVLVNAYACSPDKGSEPGMGWNWCIHLAKYCHVHVITEGEFRNQIESAISDFPYRNNIVFYYLPVEDKIRRMCWHQGDWRFYHFYRHWQWRAYKLALQIVENNRIDIIHQLNMIGFREPGYLWLIPQKSFVWGPIGGLKMFPDAFLKSAGIKNRLLLQCKNRLSILQLRYNRRVHNALKRSTLLLSSIPESYTALKKYKNQESIVVPETGCFTYNFTNNSERFYTKRLYIIWAGKFDFRKQLPLALKSIKASQNESLYLEILGSGNEKQNRDIRELIKELNISEQVKLCGNLSLSEVQFKMQNASLFFFTSVNEDTSTVIMEAISNNLPILCFDAFGFGNVVDENIGFKIPLTNYPNAIKDFSLLLNQIEHDRSLLFDRSQNCTKYRFRYSWDEKARTVNSLYLKLANNSQQGME